MTVCTPTRSKIFISYSHVDSRHLKRLETHLDSVRLDREKIDYWSDKMIKPGSEWLEEIKQAVASAKIAIFLVSADFLASKFIAANEVPPLLAAAKDDAAILLSVILGYCAFEHSELYKYEAINPPSKPLGAMSTSKRDEVWKILIDRLTVL
jgi:hypothetical protein